MAIDRSVYKQAYKLLQELEADPISVLRKAADIYKMAMEGVSEEVVSPATGEVTTIHKNQPGIAVQALQITNATVKRIHEELEKEDNTGSAETNQLVINLSELILDK